jgi:RNA polymerase sigma-70 factor, ECF subfamily
MGKNGNIGAASGAQPHDPEVPIRLATFDQYRSLLFSVAYRMLGSVADAEDMLQETFIRWQQAPDDRGRSWSPSSAVCVSITCNLRAYSARSTWASGCRSRL